MYQNYLDEGAILMTQLRKKQQNGEAECNLMCKLWGGLGDHRNLSTGNISLVLTE